MNALIERVVGWLRSGYPLGVPEKDYVPLIALLRRRLSTDEIEQLGSELVRQGVIPADRIDIGVGITKVLDELPSESEIQRVSRVLAGAGWPIVLTQPPSHSDRSEDL